jgi:thioesterase domain-containing protein
MLTLAAPDGRRSLILSKPVELSPIFCVGGLGGTAGYLRDVARAFGPSRPFVALQPPGLYPDETSLDSVEAMARLLMQEVLRLQTRGIYRLSGHSFGGLVALEMAHQLVESGRSIAHVVLLDTIRIKAGSNVLEDADDEKKAIFEVRRALLRSAATRKDADTSALAADTCGVVKTAGSERSFARLVDVYRKGFRAMVGYRPVNYPGRVSLLRARDGFPPKSLHPERALEAHYFDEDLGWRACCPRLEVNTVPGDHYSMVLGENARALASMWQMVESHAG